MLMCLARSMFFLKHTVQYLLICRKNECNMKEDGEREINV